MNGYFAVRHRERTDLFLDEKNSWQLFHRAKLHVFASHGVMMTFTSELHHSVELVQVLVAPVTAGLN